MESSVHLVVLQHGLWGEPKHLGFLQKLLSEGAARKAERERSALEVHILNCKNSKQRNTYDGIDVCAERLVKDLKAEVEELKLAGKTVACLSLLGYSLGGCICRHAIGQLEAEGFFKPVSEEGSGIEPAYFASIASPHLGSWMQPSLGFLARTFNQLVPVIASRTGCQLMLQDLHCFGRPLLLNMADPSLCFYKGLTRFKKIVLMSNVRDDRSVPYCTSSLRLSNPFEECSAAYSPDPAYPSVVLPYDDDAAAEDAAKGGGAREAPLSSKDSQRGGQWMIVPFILLLPLLLPIALIMLIVESVRGQLHFQRAKRYSPDVSWVEKTAVKSEAPGKAAPTEGRGVAAGQRTSADFIHAASQLGEAVGKRASEVHPIKPSENVMVLVNHEKVQLHEGIVQGTSKMHENQEYMVSSLSTLPWIRVDVDVFHRHAHAAIVLRTPSRYTRWDHLEFLLENVLELGCYEKRTAI